MKLRKIAGALALAGMIVPGVAGATNGYFAHGFGMKAKGMAGVGIALPQDSLAAATNPAGMAFVGNRMDFGLDWFRPIRDAEIAGSGAPVNGTYDGSGEKNFFIPEFGYNRMLNPNLAVGVSVFGNGGMNTTYDSGIPLFGNGKAGVDLMQLFIAPTVAWKITPEHSIGASINFAYQRFEANGLQNFAGSSSSPTNLTNNGYDSSYGWGLRLGWTGQVTSNVTLGATWQSETRMKAFDKYRGLFAEQGDFDIPENFGIGIAIKATPALRIAADVQWIKYGDIKSISNPLSKLFAGNPLGSSDGPGFGWRDMTVYKLGADYQVNKDLLLRAGYSYGRQPIPGSETFFNILAPGVIEDHLTLGATWTLSNGGELSVAYMHGFKKTVSGAGSIPGPFGGGEANLRMYQDSLGIAYGMKM